MAAITKTRQLLVQLDQGGGVYAAPCSINTNREFTITASALEDPEIDCDFPDQAGWMGRIIDTLSAGFSGGGTLHTPDYAQWRDWMLSGEVKSCRIKLDVPGVDGGGYFQGDFVQTSHALGKEGKGIVTFSTEIASDGTVTWVDAA